MDANRDLSVIFHSLRKKLGKKSLRTKIQQSDQTDDDYLHEVTYSPGNSSVNSTTNFCNPDGRRSKSSKKSILDGRRIANLSQTYSNESDSNTTNSNLLSLSTISNRSPPIDKHNLIYYSLILSGIGFLLPYNSFVVGAVDYFQVNKYFN